MMHVRTKKDSACKASVISDEVIVNFDNELNPHVASRERPYDNSLVARGPLQPFMKPAAHHIYKRAQYQKFLGEFQQALGDPHLASKLQNTIAAEALFNMTSFRTNGNPAYAMLAEELEKPPANFTAPARTWEQGSNNDSARVAWVDDIANHDAFLSPEGSALFQSCVQHACERFSTAYPGSGVFSSYIDTVEWVLEKSCWLPGTLPHDTSQAIHFNDLLKPQRPCIAVDESALSQVLPALKKAAREQTMMARMALREVQQASGIPGNEFHTPALDHNKARRRLDYALERIAPDSLGGRMVAQVLLNPDLNVVVVNRSDVLDYRKNFDPDAIKKRSRHGVGGFSIVEHPVVYVGCHRKTGLPGTVVEELVHQAFGQIYRNDQRTYRRDDDDSLLATKEGFHAALAADLDKLIKSGIFATNYREAVKQLRKDLVMSKKAYTRDAFDVEVVTKIIKMQATEAWGPLLEVRYPNLQRFIDECIVPDVNAWIARESGVEVTPASAVVSSPGHSGAHR